MRFPSSWRQHWIEFLLWWKKFKRKANLRLSFLQDDFYEIDEMAQPYFRAFSLLLVILAVISVLIPFAFDISSTFAQYNNELEVILLLGFVVNFVMKLILTNDRRKYVTQRWFEMVMSIVSTIFLLDLVMDSEVISKLIDPVDRSSNIYFVAILKGYLLLIAITKVIQFLPELLQDQSNSARFLVNSFLFLIASGTFLLMLPGSTVDGNGLEFIDALFTATSAVCVTGLIVVDTATHFTLFGQLTILMLIQLGGLGIITFATFLFLFISGGLGVGQMKVLKQVVSESNTSMAVSTLKKVVGFTLFTELIGAVFYFMSWSIEFESMSDRVLFSVFHSVSAFCNAGFSLFTNSLADSANVTNIGVNLTTVLLVVLGGIGFTVVWELIQKANGNSLKRRYSIHTKTVLVTTATLLVVGTAFYLLLEWGNTLSEYSVGDKFLIALFQSVTTRTAGFNTVDIGMIGIPATLVMLTLMLIGGSPASTAGGIKTTTVAVLFRSMIMTIRGYSKMELFKRTVPNPIIFQAVSVVFLALTCISVSTILLSIVEDHAFIDLLFEEVSAFATVGLSRGITSELGNWGKTILILSMFLGRVGILTFMVAFSQRKDPQKYTYPDENILIS